MSDIEQKFTKFWAIFSEKAVYDLPAEMQEEIKSAMKAAGFFDVPTVRRSSDETTGTGKKLSGYNLFFRKTMAELKEQGVPGTERMSKVGPLWKALPDEEKKEWNTQAGVISGGSAKSKDTSGKALNGYQIFLKHTMPEVTGKRTSNRRSEWGKLASDGKHSVKQTKKSGIRKPTRILIE